MKFLLFSFSVFIILSIQNQLSFAQNDDNSSVTLLESMPCGISKVRPSFLIVGGVEAVPNSWPWSVAVFRNGRFICGATMVSESIFTTAAHCVVDHIGTAPANQFQLLLGTHDVRNPDKDSFWVTPSSVIKHPNYNPSGHHNDIAVFKLAQPINLRSRSNVVPVCLPTTSDFRSLSKGTRVKLVGWGTTREGGRPSPTLRQVEVPIVDNDSCARSYANILGPNNRIDSTQICAGYPSGGRDSCQGDSGGAMLIEGRSGAYYQVGVVSFGKGCAQPGFPGVYTNVAAYVPWIRQNM